VNFAQFRRAWVALAAVIAVTACGEDNVDTLDRSIAAPRIFDFRATPSPLNPGIPTAVQWSWRYLNDMNPPPSCTIDNSVGVVLNGDSKFVTITADTTYTLTCSNRAGQGTATVTVASTGNLPPAGQIALPPSVTIAAGDSVDFASSCTDDHPVASLRTHAWDFGGAAPASTLEEPGDVRFPSPGRFTVTYTCTDNQGLADPTPDTVVVAVLGYEAPATTVTATTGPVDVKVADLNNDTFQDLVTVRSLSHDVFVQLQDSATPGTLLAGTAIPVSANANPAPVAAVIADVNADTRPDLIVANRDDDSVAVILQTTTAGTFAAAVTYAAGDGPVSVAVADLNDDTLPDIAVANQLSGNVSVLLQNATTAGTFDAAVNYETGTGSAPSAIAIGLINSDTRPDLAVTSTGIDRVSILFQYGIPADPGHFRPKFDYQAGNDPTGLVLTDLDQDGRVDIVTTNPADDQISILLQNAPPITMGTFRTRQGRTVQDNPAGISASDINGDTYPDLLVANRGSDSVSLLLTDPALPGQFLDRLDYAAGDGPVAVAAGSLTADALPDLVTADLDGDSVTVIAHSAPKPGINTTLATPPVTATTSVLSFFVYVVQGTTVTWDAALVNDAGAALGSPSTGTCDTTLHCSGTLTASATVSVTLTGSADTVATLNLSATDTVLTDNQSLDVTVDITPPADPVITTNGGADFNVIVGAFVIDGTTAADTNAIEVQIDAGTFAPVSGYVPGSAAWTYNGTIELGVTSAFCFRALDVAGNASLTDCVNVTR